MVGHWQGNEVCKEKGRHQSRPPVKPDPGFLVKPVSGILWPPESTLQGESIGGEGDNGDAYDHHDDTI